MIIPASVKTICRSGLQISQNGKLFLRSAFKDIDTENEWNGYAFRDLKPVPYYEYSETQKSGYWHFNSDGLLCFYIFLTNSGMRRTQKILRAPHSVFKKYPAAKYSGTKINQDP